MSTLTERTFQTKCLNDVLNSGEFQVISANTFKVLQDPRISVESDGGGVSLSLSDLKLTDGGEYECTLNLKQRVLRDKSVQ